MAKTIADDPIARLLPVGNSGGIRIAGPSSEPALVVLVTNGEHADWPDTFDTEAGVLTYYGDNRSPGRGLHETPRRGNLVLHRLFNETAQDRARAFPVLAFARDGSRRDQRFLGLFVPGDWRQPSEMGLTQVWRSTSGRRFSNYLASFTALDVEKVERPWLDDLLAGVPSVFAPHAWQAWQSGQPPRPLQAIRTREVRSRSEQLPDSERDRTRLADIRRHFAPDPYRFEAMAADLVKWHLGTVQVLEETRRSRDGGRDGIGLLKVGQGAASILLDFAIEAKCYAADNGVGVRQLSRLISRLRFRQFGVLVTTGYLDAQAYEELIDDRHPVVVMAAADIAKILNSIDAPSGKDFGQWLSDRYPV